MIWCIHSQIHQLDGHTQLICMRCAIRLSDFYAFKAECQAAQTTLTVGIRSTTTDTCCDPIIDQIKTETNDSFDDREDPNLVVFCETIEPTNEYDNTDDEADKKTMIPSSANKSKIIHKCDLCKKQFTSRGKLNVHCQLKHKEIFNFQCDICQLLFLRKSNLSTHLQRVHINPMRRPDKRIPKAFVEIDPTKMTRRTTCKWCVKDYGSRKLLKRHYLAEHLDLFRFKCDICQATFMRK